MTLHAPRDLAGMRAGRALAAPAGDAARTIPPADLFAALETFARVFAIREGDRVLLLIDRGLDERVVAAIDGFARARGATSTILSFPTAQQTTIPAEVRPLVERATFVVSTWFCSVFDPFCVALRRDAGQRWVKITYFRNYDLLATPQARFPIDVVAELIRATAARYRDGLAEGDGTLVITDRRGSDFRFAPADGQTERLLRTHRWRGALTADEPGAYAHYLPTHGPNLYQRDLITSDPAANMAVTGTVYPQWAVGFPAPFSEPIGVRFAEDRIVEVTGSGADAAILRGMLLGGRLIELGCGFNPKAPRYELYPAGSNAPGVLHFGIDLPEPSDYLRRMLPTWEEPPVHVDLAIFDADVRAGNRPLVSGGRLSALDDAGPAAAATRFGDPLDLLSDGL